MKLNSTDDKRKMRPLRRVAFALIVMALSWLLAWGAARSLKVSAPLPWAEALVVLSGSAAYVERTRRAASLYHEGRAPLIILTNDNQQGGWSRDEERNPYFVERAVAELLKAGVPADKIEVLKQPVSSTYEEALLLRQYAAARPAHSLLVVTSAYHSRRALWTLQRVFRDSGIVVGLEPVSPGLESPPPASWWLSLRGWRAVASEYPKILYYRLLYS